MRSVMGKQRQSEKSRYLVTGQYVALSIKYNCALLIYFCTGQQLTMNLVNSQSAKHFLVFWGCSCVPWFSGVPWCSGVLVFRGVPVFHGVPVFQCSVVFRCFGVPGFSTCRSMLLPC